MQLKSRRPLARFGRYSSYIMLSSCAMIVFGTRGFYVYGSCMEPNLRTGERVLASHVPYMFRQPSRGDVVIFKYPGDPSKNYVKRVIGVPGDVIQIRRGRLYVNRQLVKEPYKSLAAHGNYGPHIVSQGMLFVLGDNRDQSNDSRYWGELPLENVEAKALFCYWPPSQCHMLE